MGVLSISWPYLRRFWFGGLIALGAMIAQTVLTLLAPWPLKLIFDNVISKQPLAQPWRTWLDLLTGGKSETRLGLLSALIIIMLILALGSAIFSYIGARQTAVIGQRVVNELRQVVYTHLQHQSLDFYRKSQVGDLAARLTSDVQAIQDLIASGVNNLVTNFLSVVGVVIIVSIIDWHFTVIMLCATPLLLFVAGSYRQRIRRSSRQMRQAEGQVSALVQEKLNAVQVVQGFTNEQLEARQFAKKTHHSLDAALVLAHLQAEMPALVDLMGAISLAAIIWLSAREVIFNQLTPGFVLLFSAYFRSTLTPVRQLAKLSGQISKADASADRLREVLLAQPTIRDAPRALSAPRLVGSVTFENVSFGYSSRTPILRDINIEVRAGMKVALVGPTGSGKSSLLGLIPRFYDPQHGQILIDGRPLREMTLASVRDQISLVLQEPVLFNDTIRDNIAYGRPGISDAEILRVSRAANIHDMITRLPQGYATVISERGATLSGGQRQLITIARAMVRDTPIVLLDEPTTGLDADSERMVLDALTRLMAGRTTFMIAHRIHTIERADLILVLSNGQIRESGKHHELMRAQGLYARWRALQAASEPLALNA